jgi:hypothetical protein
MPTVSSSIILCLLLMQAWPLLVPERVMVRAVGHWSNTTSLRALAESGTKHRSIGAVRHEYRVDEEFALKSYQRKFGGLQNGDVR